MEHVYAGASETNTRPTKEWESIIAKLLGRRILVLKNFNDHIRDADGNVLIHLTDDHVAQSDDSSCWATIIAVGDDCRIFSVDSIGGKVKGPDWGEGVHPLEGGYFIWDEKLIGDKHNDILPYIVKE